MESLIYAIVLAAVVSGLAAAWLHGHKTGMQDADHARKQEHHEHQD
ncbi:MAG: hypothetical protein I8H71_01445 [Xanthomonadaceae bacterium]|nr:hypothetical protein [Xanthomonadaceae bacterium]